MSRLKLLVASFGFLGLARWAPGTVGTLGGVAIAYVLSGAGSYLLWVLLAIVLLYLAGRAVAPWAEERAGLEDPRWFVIDEVVGYLITVAWVSGPTLLTLLVGFFVFRFFDIAKPWPVGRLEHVRGGDGILLDDVMAGVYGLLVLAVLRTFLLEPGDWSVGAPA